MISADRLAIRDLLERGRISQSDVTRAAAHSDVDQTSLTDALIGLGIVTARDVSLSRARVRDCPYVDIAGYVIDRANADRLPEVIARRFGAFPLFVIDGIATVGMTDPLDPLAVDQIRHAMLAEVEPVLCDPDALEALIREAYAPNAADGAGSADSADTPPFPAGPPDHGNTDARGQIDPPDRRMAS